MESSLSWERLLMEIRAKCTENVKVDEVRELLESYTSDPRDWNRYATFDAHRYTRNLVDTGNNQYNLLLLCWGEGQGSPIHDHASSHCIMKMLSGELKETQYFWPDQANQEPSAMKVKQAITYSKDQVAYINDTIGLHRVENSSHVDTAVSLHLYFPPIDTCRCYNERTGEARECRVSFENRCGESCNC